MTAFGAVRLGRVLSECYRCRSGNIHAYLGDTPLLAYAQETMDVNCSLRIVGFGEDAYAVALPKHSWLLVRKHVHTEN